MPDSKEIPRVIAETALKTTAIAAVMDGTEVFRHELAHYIASLTTGHIPESFEVGFYFPRLLILLHRAGVDVENLFNLEYNGYAGQITHSEETLQNLSLNEHFWITAAPLILEISIVALVAAYLVKENAVILAGKQTKKEKMLAMVRLNAPLATLGLFSLDSIRLGLVDATLYNSDLAKLFRLTFGRLGEVFTEDNSHVVLLLAAIILTVLPLFIVSLNTMISLTLQNQLKKEALARNQVAGTVEPNED